MSKHSIEILKTELMPYTSIPKKHHTLQINLENVRKTPKLNGESFF